MKILHISAVRYLTPKNGIAVVLKYLSEEQNKIEGIQARVLSLKAGIDELDLPFYDVLKGIDFYDYLLSYKPDIVIFHSVFFVEYIKCAKILKRINIPYVIEPHGSFGKQAMKKSYIKKYIASKTIFCSFLKYAQGHIYTTKAEKDDSVFKRIKSVIIPNGIDTNVVLNAKDIKQYNSPILYFLGRFDIKHKGLDFLMESLKILDDKKQNITIRLYGIGTKTGNEFIESYIRDFKYICVTNMGAIYGDKKKEELEKANICLLTSRYEGSPMTILDALSYGNPCIVTPGTNVSEELVNNSIGWETSLNSQSIAETILKAYKEYENDAPGFIKRCKEYVLENYDWKQIAEKSIQEYRSFIQK